MTTEEKKQKLLKKIHQIEDSDLIQHFLHLIEAEMELKKREPYKLTEMEKEALKVAEADVEKGDVMNQDEADEKIKKWL